MPAKTGKHLLDFGNLLVKCRALGRTEESLVLRDDQLAVELGRRTGCDVKETNQFTSPVAPATLGDVGHDGNRGSTHLDLKAIAFLWREALSDGVNGVGYRPRSNPNFERSESGHWRCYCRR